MKKKILISAACVLAALVAAGLSAWYFLCVQVQGIYAETLPLKTSFYICGGFAPLYDRGAALKTAEKIHFSRAWVRVCVLHRRGGDLLSSHTERDTHR